MSNSISISSDRYSFHTINIGLRSGLGVRYNLCLKLIKADRSNGDRVGRLQSPPFPWFLARYPAGSDGATIGESGSPTTDRSARRSWLGRLKLAGFDLRRYVLEHGLESHGAFGTDGTARYNKCRTFENTLKALPPHLLAVDARISV